MKVNAKAKSPRSGAAAEWQTQKLRVDPRAQLAPLRKTAG